MSEKEFTHFTDKWADIEDLVRRWVRRFPTQYKENMRWVQEARQDYKQGKYADRPVRSGVLIHPSLMVYIQQFHPTFMDTKDDLRQFSKRFKGFVVDAGVMPAK